MNTVTLEEGGKIICISIPMTFKKRGGRKEIILPQGARQEERPEPANALALAVAKAHCWRKMIDNGEVASLGELAKRLRLHRCYLRRLLYLSFLAPDIVEAILDGQEPSGLSLGTLSRPIPMSWSEQRERYGFAVPAARQAARIGA